MDVKCVTEIASHIAICIGVIVAIQQLFLMKRMFRADHKRRKEQGTFEFYRSIRPEIIALLRKIDAKFPHDRVITIHDIKDDDDMLDTINEYLSHMDRLAIAINIGIYDIDVFQRMNGARTVWWFDRLGEFIQYVREFYNYPLYTAFQDLVTKLKELQEKGFSIEDHNSVEVEYDFEMMECYINK